MANVFSSCGSKLAAVALTMAALLPAALPAQAQRPAGWKVKISHQPLLAKQSIYGFTVMVRDASGKEVDDATVRLQIPGFRRDDPIVVPARHVGQGRYYAKAHLPMADTARYVRALVNAGSTPR